MAKALCRIMASIALAFVCSCVTGKPYTYEGRKQRTGISADEGVVILLNTFRSNLAFIESEGEEKSLEDCVKTGMMNINPKLKSVPAKDFRRMVFPDKRFLDSPRSPKDLLAFLSDPDAQSRVMGLGVRYVIVLTATNSKGEKVRHYSDPTNESTLYVAEDWSLSSSRDAVILDVKYLRESGSVGAGCQGTGFWTAGCLSGCPPTPCVLCNFPRTEAKACSALGEDVMKFLIDGRDMVPTPELGTGIDSGGRGSDIQSDIQTAPQPVPEEDRLKGPREPGGYDKDSQN